MLPSFPRCSSDTNDPQNNRSPVKTGGGLKRSAATTKLRPIMSKVEVEENNSTPSSVNSRLTHSSSLANFKKDGISSESIGNVTPIPKNSLTRTKTHTGPLKLFPDKSSQISKLSSSQSISNLRPELRRITPLRISVDDRTPGGTCSKASFKRIAPATVMESVEEALTPKAKEFSDPDKVTPPLRRIGSGSMLLRATPERNRRFGEEEGYLPIKPLKRISSDTKLNRKTVADSPIKRQLVDDSPVPLTRRKRTNSASLLSSPSKSTPLVPVRQSPRRISESSGTKPPVSPVKKRARLDSESGNDTPKRSPMKKCTSTATIRFQGGITLTPNCQTPTSAMKRFKSVVKIEQTERIRQQMIDGIKQKTILPIQENSSTIMNQQKIPELKHCSTSGDSYKTAEEESPEKKEVFVTPENSLKSDTKEEVKNKTEMVPLVKKQLSIDEETILDDEDEGFFGDSTKTIKKGQGIGLARSVSLKLSPRQEEKKIGVDTEKSSSTPSLPTVPLQRKTSTSSLRFKVSPSTFLKNIEVKKVQLHVEPAAVASTSTQCVEEVRTKQEVKEGVNKIALKSAMKKVTMRNECETPKKGTFGQRKVKFEGVRVFYFDRIQGGSTVPTDGEVTLGMDHEHHAKRFFPLSTGRRPDLDLGIHDDEDLSDGEVVTPDSDEETTYVEFSTAKTIPRVLQRFRIKMLQKSGVKINNEVVYASDLRQSRSKCGCNCENGVCLPETCKCSIEGVECQLDGGYDGTPPCECFAEYCTNPNGRIYYDYEFVNEYRTRTIMNWNAMKKSGIEGSPVVKKFTDYEDDGQKQEVPQSPWLLKNAIPLKLEESPTKYPVTPIYTTRTRASLSEIRESCSETNETVTPMTITERIREMGYLDNDVCVEDETEQDRTVVEAEITVREVDIAIESDSTESLTNSNENLDKQIEMTNNSKTLVL